MQNFTAKWIPAWYALDQKIRKGSAGKFLFTKGERSFFNGLGDPLDTESLYVRILSIRHPVLGGIDEADTLGLSYWIWIGDDVIQVEAEEEPGRIERSTLNDIPAIKNFDLEIELEPALPSQVGELDMIAVMLNDDVPGLFKWWGHSLEDADDAGAVLDALLHYSKLLFNNEKGSAELADIFRFIHRMYEWGNPYISSLFDEHVLQPLLRQDRAGEYIAKFGGSEMQDRYLAFTRRTSVLNALWK
jgi:hypothetical protein